MDQYEASAALRAEDGGAAARQRLRDVAHTLCVSTDTRDIDSALAAARRPLSRPGPVAAGRPPG